MDPLSLIVMAMVAGAAAGLKPTAEAAVKDAYTGLKRLIKQRFERVSVDVIEGDPSNSMRQRILKDDLQKTGAGQDPDVLKQAQEVIDTVLAHAPQAATSVGIKLDDLTAASVSLKRILADRINIEASRAQIRGDFVIEDVGTPGGGSGTSHP
jgi:hypothetical protein